MPNPHLSREDAEATVDAVNRTLPEIFTMSGDRRPRGLSLVYRYAGMKLGMSESSVKRRIERAWQLYKLSPDWKIFDRLEQGLIAKDTGQSPKPKPILSAPAHYQISEVPTPTPPLPTDAEIAAFVRKGGATLEQIAIKFNVTQGQALDALDRLKNDHHSIQKFGDKYEYHAIQVPHQGDPDDEKFTYYSRPDNTYLFGACGDNHLGSKYERLDVLNELYDFYKEEGVDRVFNTGNWIDGEARFNKTDLHTFGLDAQCRYLAEKYPQREGLVTYAVAGDDHEGWYAQREGVDIGAYAENKFKLSGRTDWVHLGFMEARIKLVNSNTGSVATLSVVHPGGGSAYATSYSIQKIIESLDGGEKPAVGLYGHYHKLWAGNIRNVWCVQTGTTEDQTPFMRKRKIQAHVGGTIVQLHQDPESGAIYRCKPEMLRWFNTGYFNESRDRWSHSDSASMSGRVLGRE
jgi:hypothetical protein